MAVYSDNLASMSGRVRGVKPNAQVTQIRAAINDRIRFIIDSQIFWADLLASSVLSMPAVYVTGTVALTNGSKTVTGTSTAWPITDVSNTTIAVAVTEYGVQTVTPASMTGIEVDSLLYVDASGSPEAVAVLEVGRTTFKANFQKLHSAAFTVTQSSLAGLQLVLGSTIPIYTIRAVVSSTSFLIDQEWGITALTGSSYQIIKCYFTISPDLKDIVALWDPTQGRPMAFHKSQDYLNYRDPQRASTGVPLVLADFIPTEAGTMQYELWPHQTISYQIPILYCKQWPELKNPTDQPPWFINPSIIIAGATADALRIRNQQIGSDAGDPFFDPKTAEIYERQFQVGLAAAVNANQSKALTVLEQFSNFFGYMPGGNWSQAHLTDEYYGSDGW